MLNVSPLRQKGRALAARLLASAQSARVTAGDRACTDRAIARYWGQGSPDKISKLFRPTSGKHMVFGDVLALPREFARDILIRALAAIDEGTQEPAPQDTVYKLGIELGEAMRVLMVDLANGGKPQNHGRYATGFARIAAIALRGQSAAERAAQGEVR